MKLFQIKQTQADQPYRLSIHIFLITLLAYAHHNHQHHHLLFLYLINNAVALPYRSYTTIPLQILPEGFSLLLWLIFKSSEASSQHLLNSSVRNELELLFGNRHNPDSPLLHSQPNSFSTSSRSLPLPSSISFMPCRRAAIVSSSCKISIVSTSPSAFAASFSIYVIQALKA